MDQLDTLVAIAADLASAQSAEARSQSLLGALRRVIPFDAAALLRLDGDALVPLAAHGLSPSALGRRYLLREHPRLDILCKSNEPVRFPPDTALPDPFDGLLAADPAATRRVHACLGCALRVHGQLVGVLTADALEPRAFERIDVRLLTAVGALAAAELLTGQLIAALTRTAERQGQIARDLMRDALLQQGSQLLGVSPELGRLRQEIELVARSDYSVLITGETGVGKELVARAVHSASPRREQPLIYVNCAALPETLAEAELFGHTRGAFTGASAERAGKFEVADGGTLFLDEIGELPLSVQPKLLRALQAGEIQRVGADRPLRVDVRLLAATNRDLAAEVQAGRFRADLYHRLHVYPLAVPPLRARRGDIALLAGYFCDLSRRRLGLGPVRLDAGALAALERYAWPGNVRELEHVVSRVVLRASAGVPRGQAIILQAAALAPDLAGAPDLPSAAPVDGPAAAPGRPRMRDFVRAQQRAYLRTVLEEHHGNLAAAARALGMDRGNLHHLARRLGLGRRES
ncbi:MAG TPA: nitric oxide reductase transcriptional regulator NorR [Myxococcota bacterium]|nr:nitric oxide reductase transcriptional regulator NorR [Myxococcota bacterium]HRY94608.1 nitric oxide reductase transcriptional regulator NorR [Myxococcota bacterium]HSA20236.1 nitric oxide reductase transcriptional regulator NorR [Myxococcota bacterium]